jgi:predicted DCC family thiol-disulfide oxidoreductase YuxK
METTIATTALNSAPDEEILLGLPSPADRPAASVVIFDGQCRFCLSQVARFHAWDHQGRLAFLSLHDPLVHALWPDLTHDMLMREMYVIDPAGNRHAGFDSLKYLSRQLPRLWWLAPFLHIPLTRPLWSALYAWVARNRYRWGQVSTCQHGACRAHKPGSQLSG